jgi:hypothetical protein
MPRELAERLDRSVRDEYRHLWDAVTAAGGEPHGR